MPPITAEPLEPRTHFAATAFQFDHADLSTAAGGSFSVVQTLRIDDGRTFLLGVDKDSRLAVAAVDARGDLIQRFDGDGVAVSPVDRVAGGQSLSSYNLKSALARDAAGNLYLVGRGEVVRLRPDGRRDLTYGRRGVLSFEDPRVRLEIQDAHATADGRLIVAARTLVSGREKYYLYELTPTGSRLAWSVNRSVGSDLTFESNRLHAFLRREGRGFVLAFQEQTLDYTREGSLTIPIQRRNVLTLARFDRRLRQTLLDRIELPKDASPIDARVFDEGAVLVATDQLQTIKFDSGRTPQRYRRVAEPRSSEFVVRITADGHLWTIVSRLTPAATFNTVRKIAVDGLIPPGAAATAQFEGSEVTGNFRLFDDGSVLVDQKADDGTRTTRLVQPDADGPKVRRFFNYSYGVAYYPTIYFTSKAHLGRGTFDASDLVVTGPGGDATVAGPNGFFRGVFKGVPASAQTIGVRFFLRGPGGSWGPEDDGLYVIRLKPGRVTDALGATNTSQIVGTFDANHAIDFGPSVPG
ncbi:MAG TPA: hypothetical protein VF624_10635 [Tepidisphaeraceae bacterium]|jgi:hypothetical protein